MGQHFFVFTARGGGGSRAWKEPIHISSSPIDRSSHQSICELTVDISTNLMIHYVFFLEFWHVDDQIDNHKESQGELLWKTEFIKNSVFFCEEN